MYKNIWNKIDLATWLPIPAYISGCTYDLAQDDGDFFECKKTSGQAGRVSIVLRNICLNPMVLLNRKPCAPTQCLESDFLGWSKTQMPHFIADL